MKRSRSRTGRPSAGRGRPAGAGWPGELCGLPQTAPKPSPRQEPGLYHPPGMSMWDTWYLQRGDETHVFHLQLRRDNARPASDHESIGHAVSTRSNSLEGTACGPAQRAQGQLRRFLGAVYGLRGRSMTTRSTSSTAAIISRPTAADSRCAWRPRLPRTACRFTRYEGNPIIEPDPQALLQHP